jgi:hypothetical protein
MICFLSGDVWGRVEGPNLTYGIPKPKCNFTKIMCGRDAMNATFPATRSVSLCS